jgi:hypothetical protein
MVGIAIPPFVTHLEIGVWVVRASFAGLTGSGLPVVPQVLLGGVIKLARHKCFVLMVVNQAGVLESIFFRDVLHTAFFSCKSDFLPALLFFEAFVLGSLRGFAPFGDITFFAAVLSALVKCLALLDMRALELLDGRGQAALGLEYDSALKMRSAVFANLLAISCTCMGERLELHAVRVCSPNC